MQFTDTLAKRKRDDAPPRKPHHDKKRPRKAAKPVVEGSHEEVLMHDIRSLLARTRISNGNEAEEGTTNGTSEQQQPAATALPERFTEIELEIIELSSTGDGLARQQGSDRIYTVPFTVPGDVVKARVYRHMDKEPYSVADFVSVVKPSPLRDDARIQCPYFAKCAGCQFQMVDYDEQLKIKRTVVEKAYKNFSNLPQELVPSILDTMGSPLQYGYRTKLTPHFDGPHGPRKVKKYLQEVPVVGFTTKGSKKMLDIEDCPIGTSAVRLGLKRERKRMETEYSKYSKGATILLRENTVRIKDGSQDVPPPDSDSVKIEGEGYTDYKTCETDNNATTTEYIDDFIFTNPAGSFFQNNNSILSPFTAYVRDHMLPPASASATAGGKEVKYLIDAYSGSGLFTITLSPTLFPKGGTSVGIDIDEKSISFARNNARLNGLQAGDKCKFIAADANQLFESVKTYDPDETVVVLDPPRRGCDKGFLKQLLEFRPRRVVYVSCNVHTQARDVGILVRGEVDGSEVELRPEGQTAEKGAAVEKVAEGAKAVVDTVGDAIAEAAGGEQKKTRYAIESIRGFDFFPQTSHVEGVAILNRVDE
ncbi:S-adenosyl-L-methionine-dependent methyltransferase [Coniochaeta sp. 2T2.1]|nr:S-adenosyl-L-methionine-dependent methyltransferase [Coniochaeta sp. 2T2.1]